MIRQFLSEMPPSIRSVACALSLLLYGGACAVVLWLLSLGLGK